jgi:hypothetical protein
MQAWRVLASGSRRLVVAARRQRWLAAAVVGSVAVVPSFLVLWRLPHEWRYVGPLMVLWVASVGALAVLFGAGKVLGPLAVALATAAAVGIPFKWVLSNAVTVGGEVTCASGANVVGVFLRAKDGEAGWTNWAPGDSESRASYSFPLQRRVAFRLGVGCGGSPQHWRVDLVTAWVSPGQRSFVCFDRHQRGARRFGACALRRSLP